MPERVWPCDPDERCVRESVEGNQADGSDDRAWIHPPVAFDWIWSVVQVESVTSEGPPSVDSPVRPYVDCAGEHSAVVESPSLPANTTALFGDALYGVMGYR